MKRVLLAILLVVGITTIAQERKMKDNDLTPEERVELQVKKMTLDLDLSAKQQNEIKTILLENAKLRETKIAEMKKRKESGEKLTKEERLKMENERLDNQIEMKQKMKTILTVEQMKKWEEKQERREEKMKSRREKMGQKREKK